MTARKKTKRFRIGRVSYFFHHGSWYLYFRDNKGVHRVRIGPNKSEAEQAAAIKNAELTSAQVSSKRAVTGIQPNHEAAPNNVTVLLEGLLQALSSVGLSQGIAMNGQMTTPAVPSISISKLREAYIDHHENVQCSALSTIVRYSAATQHLINFAEFQGIENAEDISANEFVRYLRNIEVSPNGHKNAKLKSLSDKGVQFILQTCGAMYRFGLANALLSKQFENPYAKLGLRRMKIRDAKPIFIFSPEVEVKFLQAADPWTFAVHFTLCKTGLRPGELVHTLIEDIDIEKGWLHVRSKHELGWSIKTGSARDVPLAPEVLHVLKKVIGKRVAGPLFLRVKLCHDTPPKISGNRNQLETIAQTRLDYQRRQLGRKLSRKEKAAIFQKVWSDAGAVSMDRVRTSFIRTAKILGINATCPKSWRHTFATLLQEANIDPLVRQITMGHKPTNPEQSPLGMTSIYTHTQPAVQHKEILRALRFRAESLKLGLQF